ncbi:uncharacterized protein LOC144365097 [Ictidomys tridecemlineatus]
MEGRGRRLGRPEAASLAAAGWTPWSGLPVTSGLRARQPLGEGRARGRAPSGPRSSEVAASRRSRSSQAAGPIAARASPGRPAASCCLVPPSAAASRHSGPAALLSHALGLLRPPRWSCALPNAVELSAFLAAGCDWAFTRDPRTTFQAASRPGLSHPFIPPSSACGRSYVAQPPRAHRPWSRVLPDLARPRGALVCGGCGPPPSGSGDSRSLASEARPCSPCAGREVGAASQWRAAGPEERTERPGTAGLGWIIPEAACPGKGAKASDPRAAWIVSHAFSEEEH